MTVHLTQISARLDTHGFVVLSHDAATYAWSKAVRERAQVLTALPENKAKWLRCNGTWFAGVDILDNSDDGSIGPVVLAGKALSFLDHLGWTPARWHAAQVSVVYPGYPQPREGESPVAARYRLRRDAAHVDGLLAEGPERRRFIREPHAFILGLPLTPCSAGAAPLVAWAGSHRIMQRAFSEALNGQPADRLSETDITDVYVTARRRCFAACPRIPVSARPGQAVLLHPLTLHGIGPFQPGAHSPAEGRMVAYFRPDHPQGIPGWLEA